MRIKYLLLLLVFCMGLSACTDSESPESMVGSDLEATSSVVSSAPASLAPSYTVSVGLLDPDTPEEDDSIPVIEVSSVPVSSHIDFNSDTYQTYKKQLWEAWNLPENEKPAAWVNGEAIPKRLPLSHYASIWLSIYTNVYYSEEEKNAVIEQYGRTYEECVQEMVHIEIAYQEGKKQGLDYPEETARAAIIQSLDDLRLIEGFYDFFLEATGFDREEYIEAYLPIKQKTAIAIQYKNWLKQNLPSDWPVEDPEGYVTHYLESKMEEYKVKIVA